LVIYALKGNFSGKKWVRKEYDDQMIKTKKFEPNAEIKPYVYMGLFELKSLQLLM
jgi:hypothetical protein